MHEKFLFLKVCLAKYISIDSNNDEIRVNLCFMILPDTRNGYVGLVPEHTRVIAGASAVGRATSNETVNPLGPLGVIREPPCRLPVKSSKPWDKPWGHYLAINLDCWWSGLFLDKADRWVGRGRNVLSNGHGHFRFSANPWRIPAELRNQLRLPSLAPRRQRGGFVRFLRLQLLLRSVDICYKLE
jgi:hypothetical protein